MSRAARGIPALAAAAILLCSGCSRRIWYEWKDEPYMQPVYAGGTAEATRYASSPYASDRDIGLRVLSVMAKEARESGDEKEARRIANLIMERYWVETSEHVRSTIVAVCMRNAGRGDAAAEAFLKNRLAAGEEAVSAAYALAALKAPGSGPAIQEAFSRTRDYGRKYEFLEALWLLGGPPARQAYDEALSRIANWPRKIHHMPKSVYRKTMESRRRTLGKVETP
ncbi:MAG: hypothetical protein JW909_04900 [Planctomycetes bacterium]|nr:hypothetical protein [Planctomycetota bacterium]